jgi:hypothetical protein
LSGPDQPARLMGVSSGRRAAHPCNRPAHNASRATPGRRTRADRARETRRCVSGGRLRRSRLLGTTYEGKCAADTGNTPQLYPSQRSAARGPEVAEIVHSV